MASPILNRTLGSALVDRLRAEIMEGALAPGTPLRQDALAANYGVSRIPVREALIQLEAEGLVESVPHRGAVVTRLSEEEVADVFALRRLLEPRLLRASLPRLSELDLGRLEKTGRAFAEAIRTGDAARWGRLNADLHVAMYLRADQPRTLAIVRGLLGTSERYTRIQLDRAAAWRRAQDEHNELVELCRARDVDRAVAALEAHIGQVRDDLAALMRAGGGR